MKPQKRITETQTSTYTPSAPVEINIWSPPTIEAKAPEAANDTAATRRPNILEKRRRRRARMVAR